MLSVGHATRSFHRSCSRSRVRAPKRSSITSVHAYADGASRGNPGRSGCGALLVDPLTGRVLATDTKYVGDNKTNNEAEYHGLVLALQLAHRYQAIHVHVHMDSQLIVRQMQDRYRVRATNLWKLHQQCKKLSAALPFVTFIHVDRDNNVAADRLANEAIQDSGPS
ncbi:hypothetical protein PsorP6_007160 [Peronosclerospora sorghi]|uniref:Uncharacterized protein n=1 Tax=Peronosclerospora sorghi TaxID=230839 RepID=A0ACC0WBH8_9STRA|nr:hypothetical protein PsorP6_007160 [Peronosclerospora sorghi]